jgi:hypothetical protein
MTNEQSGFVWPSCHDAAIRACDTVTRGDDVELGQA